jgi:hypothetical protein
MLFDEWCEKNPIIKESGYLDALDENPNGMTIIRGMDKSEEMWNDLMFPMIENWKVTSAVFAEIKIIRPSIWSKS